MSSGCASATWGTARLLQQHLPTTQHVHSALWLDQSCITGAASVDLGCACKQAFKTMGICDLPDTLVLHLKRFEKDDQGRSHSKLDTMVECPLGLDMAPFMLQQQVSSCCLCFVV